MRAVVFVQNRVRVEDVPRPRVLEPGDAVVAVTATSICGSDLHLLGGKPPGMRDGAVIGHEFVGVVADAGPEARRHPEGTRVVGSFLIACGRCERCRAGRFNLCRSRRALGLGTLTGDLDGAQAEYVRVPDADVNLLAPEGVAPVSDEQALFCGDVLPAGMYAARLAEAGPGEAVVVIGAGPVGLFAAASARRAGALVSVVDVDARRVEFARAAFDLDARTPDAAVDEADAAIEAVGAVSALGAALRAVREGGRVAVVGVYGKERYDLPLGVLWSRAVELRFGGMANVQGHWDDALTAVASGEIDAAAAITHRLPLAHAEEAYELFRERRAVKILLTP